THDVSEAVFLSQRIYIMSARPGTVRKEVTVDLGSDRAYAVRRTPEFYRYCEDIMDLLRERPEMPMSA
ncbi:MAG TPA: ABC transporter ATP-binding protein, partial [Leptolyngbyaceae cyanobacterium]